MDKKRKSLSYLIADTLYKECCKGKQCENCKYNTTNLYCHIARINKIIEIYERVIFGEENNKNK